MHQPPGSNQEDTVLILNGTGFSDTSSDNSVMIGGVACVVTSSTSTQIQCDIGQGPAGPHEVLLNVASKGLARHVGGTMTFTYIFFVDSFSPTEGSVSGEESFSQLFQLI